MAKFPESSKKDKRNKKGKKKGASKGTSGVRDEDDPKVLPVKVLQDVDKAEDHPFRASDFQGEIKPNVILANVSQDDKKKEGLPAITHDSRNQYEPCIVPTEFPHNDCESDNRFTVDRPSVTSDFQREIESKSIAYEAPPDNDTLEDSAVHHTPPMRAEGHGSGETLEPALIKKVSQHSGKGEFKEVPMEQEQQLTQRKGKKDKRKSKKSKKPSAYSPDDDDDNPALEDGQMSATNVHEKGELAQPISSGFDIREESDKTVPERRLEKEENFIPSPHKREKMKPTRTSTFSLDRDVLTALKHEASIASKDVEEESPEQTLPSVIEVVEEIGTLVEGFSGTKESLEELEGQRSEGKSEDSPAQFEAETARDPQEYSKIHTHINTFNTSADLGMVGGKHEEGLYEECDPLPAHAATPRDPHKLTSPMRSSLDQSARASEETTTYHGDEVQDIIIPTRATDMNFHMSPKPSKKNEKRTKKARQLIGEKVEVFQEPKVVFSEPDAAEDAGEPSIFHSSQNSETLLKPTMSAQKIESAEIVTPGILSKEDRGFKGSTLADTQSEERHDVQIMIEADQEDSYTNVERVERSERTNSEEIPVPEPEDHESPIHTKEPAWATATDHVERNGLTLDQESKNDMDTAGAMRSQDENTTVESERGQDSMPGVIDEDGDLPLDMAAQIAEKPRRQHEVQQHKPRMEDLSAFVAPGSSKETGETFRNVNSVTDTELLENLDKPNPTSEIELSDAKDQREYNDESARELERAVPKTDFEPLEGSDIEQPMTAVGIEMLDAQQQREYNEEYTKELERQLSPLQEGEHANISHDTARFSPSNITSLVERTYQGEHQPLAQPPALEDILEESRSRSGSIQGSPAERDDEPSPVPIKSNSKGRKGKKGKRQQLVVWEDETATPPLEPESDQGADPSSKSSQNLDLWSTDAAQPLELEEQVQQQSFEDRITASPNEDFNTAYKCETENYQSSGYFTIQPSKLAEEDVKTEDTQEFRRALATEVPYTRKDQSPFRTLQSDQHNCPRNGAIETHTQDEGLVPLTGFHIDPRIRTEAEPAKKKNVEEKFNPASMNGTQDDIKAEKKSPAKEPYPYAMRQVDAIDQTPTLKTPTADTSYERSPSRQYTSQPPSDEDKPSYIAEARSNSLGESRDIEEVATALTSGVCALAVESLFKGGESKNGGARGKKAEKAGSWTDIEGETDEPEHSLGTLDKGEMAIEQQEHHQTSELESAKRAWQQPPATPPRSPSFAKHEAIEDQSVTRSPSQSSAAPAYRDSAIYVSSSPMISEETPYHRAVRDSGYLDTEASLTIDDKPENLEASPGSKRRSAIDEMAGHEQPWHGPGHETYEPHTLSSRNPLEISVEVDSDYDVSISRPRERRKHSRGRSDAAYDSDYSAVSGFDVQRRRRRQAMAAESREPSPVSFTTKDRSSALFESSPSAKEDLVVKPPDRDLSPRNGPIGEKPTWSFGIGNSSQHRPHEVMKEDGSDNIPEGDGEPTDYSMSTGHHRATGMSLFGGPRTVEGDVRSPSRSPCSSESRGRRRLNTISEDGSRLHGRDKRAVSDVGSPESGVKGRRIRSPPVGDELAGEHRITHNAISPQSWPAIGETPEGKSSMDERSRSRHSVQLSALSSQHSTLPGVRPGHGEGEHRTTSAASIRSEKSIHAILRSPDQVRSASGLGYHSSATPPPPLRRVDRSASGDLRGASMKDEAKIYAKNPSSEIDPEPEIHNNIGIPSSSTYDPVTDKGKFRADMADVYVSLGKHSFER